MAVAGLLLTGGASRRMGFDKARMRISGEVLAERVGRLLQSATVIALEVGPGVSGLTLAAETAPGSGPLAALGDGVAALVAAGHSGPALVLSTDLAAVDRATLDRLAGWPGGGSVVPVLEGRPQTLCARWSAAALASVTPMVAAGERAMWPLLERSDTLISDAFAPGPLRDVDTPDQLDALGLDWEAP